MRHQGVQIIEVAEEYSGQRLDNFLLRELRGLPRARLYRLLRKGEVRVNKKRCKPDLRLQAGDQLRLPPVQLPDINTPAVASTAFKHSIQNACIYEDQQLIIFNKPSGIAVHGGSGVHLGFIDAVRQAYQHAQKWELVHRIDKDTSGCLMISKKRSCLRHLQDALRAAQIDKTYWAVVNGVWKHTGEVRAPLQKYALSSGEARMRVHAQGKDATTHFKPLASFKHASLVQAKPLTGRTHQIRVHAQFKGYSLAGDSKYASDEQNAYWREQGLHRLFLHARALELQLPNGKKIQVQAELPHALQSLVKRLGADHS